MCVLVHQLPVLASLAHLYRCPLLQVVDARGVSPCDHKESFDSTGISPIDIGAPASSEHLPGPSSLDDRYIGPLARGFRPALVARGSGGEKAIRGKRHGATLTRSLDIRSSQGATASNFFMEKHQEQLRLHHHQRHPSGTICSLAARPLSLLLSIDLRATYQRCGTMRDSYVPHSPRVFTRSFDQRYNSRLEDTARGDLVVGMGDCLCADGTEWYVLAQIFITTLLKVMCKEEK